MGRSPALAIVCLLGLVPVSARADDWVGPDKALHFAVSGALAIGGYALAVPLLEERAPRIVVGASVALSLGLAKELADLAGAGEASWRDLVWDLIGSATGTLLAWVVDLLAGGGRARESTTGATALRSGLALAF